MHIFTSKCAKKRLADGLCTDPLEQLKRSITPLASAGS